MRLAGKVLPSAPEVEAYHAVQPERRDVVHAAVELDWQAYQLPRPERLLVQDRVVCLGIDHHLGAVHREGVDVGRLAPLDLYFRLF